MNPESIVVIGLQTFFHHFIKKTKKIDYSGFRKKKLFHFFPKAKD